MVPMLIFIVARSPSITTSDSSRKHDLLISNDRLLISQKLIPLATHDYIISNDAAAIIIAAVAVAVELCQLLSICTRMRAHAKPNEPLL